MPGEQAGTAPAAPPLAPDRASASSGSQVVRRGPDVSAGPTSVGSPLRSSPTSFHPPSFHPPLPGENVSQALKDQIREMALGLLEEQVQARIAIYKAELETNPELDAITAQVVAQLKEIQARAAQSGHTAAQSAAIRESHKKLLKTLLERVFRTDGPSLLVEKRLKEIHRKLARLFFQSELHEKTRGKDGSTKVIHHGEQAVFYVLARYDNRLRTELSGFEYASLDVKERAFDLLAKFSKDMQDAFLSRRSSELKRIVSAFNAVLIDFLCKELAQNLADLAREVIEQAKSYEGRSFPYKITADAFPSFRAAFERALMTRLIGFAEDQLLTRLADTAGAEREETLLFITDPRVFSMILGELCDGLYEFLCNEGFLDLPPDWRQTSSTQPST
jgi:hypothetical protein